MYYRAKYVFSKPIDKEQEKLITDEFFELRKAAVEKLNPLYDEWNREWNKTHELAEGQAVGKDYYEYICQKQNEILAEVNKEFEPKYVVLDSDPEEYCDIIGITKKEKARLDMLMIPVK